MALFKIFKGQSGNLGQSSNGTNKTYDGYAYFTPDDGKFYIDIATSNSAITTGTNRNRVPLSAEKADLIKQYNTTNSENYKILLSYSANPQSGAIDKINYGTNLTYNPVTNKLSTGNIKLTGELDVTGNAYLRNETTADSLIAGSLLVNGSATFVNTINGSINGNAATATNVAWSGITGKPSTFTPSSHTHYALATIGDQRSTATTPNTYSNRLIFQGLKTNSAFGSPSTDSYSYVIGLRGWSDSSGGNSHELAFNNTGIFWRNGATTSWGSWYRIYTTGNKPTNSDVGLGNVTNHQQVHEVAWDSTNKKITRSKNGTAGDVVQFVAGSNVTLTAESGKLTIASSYTNSRDPGYGKIKAGTASTATSAITANTSTAEASTYNETLTINPGNKWIQVAATNSSTAGSDSFTIGHSVSGATAGNYGDSSNQTPGYGSTFKVPYISVDAGGHITSISEHTVKIPASDNTNTDTLVKQTAKTDNVEYKILTTTSASPTSGNAAEAAYDTGVTINPSTHTVTASTYKVTTNAVITYNTANGCLEITV